MSDLDAAATAAAWSEFCDAIKRAGITILESYPQPTDVDRAEGLRYLAQQVQASIQDALVGEPGEPPLLRVGANTLNKWGMDSADCKTQSAHLDSAGTYRLSGRRGNARLVAVQVMVLEPEFVAFASLSEDALGADSAGQLDVVISAARPADWTGPWLEMDPATTTLVIREYFADWEHEAPGSFRIERVDTVPTRPIPTLAGARRLLDQAAGSFATRPTRWLPNIDPVRAHLVNRLAAKPPTDQGLADNIYGSGWFQLAADEALVIELDAPDALLWSFQLANVWSESLDSINHSSSLNGDQSVASSDGRYRIVVAHEDPGVANWLDTVGHPEGVILFRFQQSNNCPQPSAVVVAFGDVRDALPADTAVVTIAERAASIAHRRAHAAVRWAP